MKNLYDDIENVKESTINHLFKIHKDYKFDNKNTLLIKKKLKFLFGADEVQFQFENFIKFLKVINNNKLIIYLIKLS